MSSSFTGREFQSKLNYREALRDSTSLIDVTFYRLGLMNETLVDLLMLNVLLENPSPFIDHGDPSEQVPAKPVPRYLLDVFGDFRETGSFHRKDKWKMIEHYPKEVRKGYRDDVAEIANKEHLFLRKLGNELGTLFDSCKLPEPVNEQVNHYKEKIEEYLALVKEYGTYRAIPDTRLARYNDELREVITSLREAFDSVEKFAVTLPKSPANPHPETFTLDNTKPINPKLPDSKPLAFLFIMTAAGRHVIDREFYPEVGFDYSTEVVGVESLISESMKLFVEQVEKKLSGSLFHKLPFDRDAFKQLLEKSSRNVMLLHAFHNIVDRAYPVAYTDLEERLYWIGRTPDEVEITAPKEVAVLLYGTACRLRKDLPSLSDQIPHAKFAFEQTRQTSAQVIQGLLLLADTVAKKKTLKEAENVCAASPAYWSARIYANALSEIQHSHNRVNDPVRGFRLLESKLQITPTTDRIRGQTY